MTPKMSESVSTSEGCSVCGDRVNSYRYGSPACLGCTVFFRRAIVKNLLYKCPRDRNCVVDNEHRRSCRYCRLQKCFQMGMKADNIQRRDVVGPRRPLVYKTENCSIRILNELERFQQHQLVQYLQSSPRLQKTNLSRSRATSHDVNIMLKFSIQQAAEWGREFVPFRRLSLESTWNILAEYGLAFLLLDQGFKTANEAEEGFWLLQNGTFMHPNYFLGLSDKDVNLEKSKKDAILHYTFVMELLTCVSKPIRNLKIDMYECAALKTLLLLTPSFSKRAVYDGQEESVAALHSQCLNELMEHSEQKCPGEGAERFGEIILFIRSIRCGVKAFYNHTRVSDLFNLIEIDPFVKNIMLC